MGVFACAVIMVRRFASMCGVPWMCGSAISTGVKGSKFNIILLAHASVCALVTEAQ